MRKPLLDKIILLDTLFAISIVGNWLDIIAVPIAVEILLIVLIIALELFSVTIQRGRIDSILEIVCDIFGDDEE